MWQYVIILILSTGIANAQNIIDTMANNNQDTIVYGEALNADGTENQVLLEQPKNAPNPLGNPIVSPSSFPQKTDGRIQDAGNPIKPTNGIILQNSPQNPKISEMSPQQMDSEIQNKLYQEGNRVYDIQSYPASDLQTINQNGQDNAVTNYPAY